MSSRLPPINFQLIASEALSRWNLLLPQWLFGGKLDGHEFKALNPTRSDSKVGSFSVNVRTGAWADFATGDKGGDLISLWAYLQGIDQLKAAREVAAIVGVEIPEQYDSTSAKLQKDPAKLKVVSTSPAEGRKSPWRPIMPVPDDAPEPPVAHYARGRPDVIYTYRADDGRVNGYVYRFTTSDGGKETLPVCFCRNQDDRKGGWRWMAFSESRPLYGLDLLASYPDLPVLLVEGEKCADIGNEFLLKKLNEFVIVTWPGGTKAVQKAFWKVLAERKTPIFAWADCDAQRRKLTGHEKASGVDPHSVPLLPESDQPSMRAMREIHKILLSINPDVDFQFVDIPKPGDKKSGWDIADAIAEGMSGDDLVKFIRKTRVASNKRPPGAVNRSPEGLLLDRDYKIRPVLANIHDILQTDEHWNGVIAFNEFSCAINKLKPPPYHRGVAGEWEVNDDIQTAMWLTREYGFAPTPQQVAEAIEALARAGGYHPVRNYLKAQVWDETDRLDYWIPDFIGVARTPYTMRISRWFLMAMVARVMKPGVKFDYCLVLEGAQGRGKTSFFRVLAGEWFGNTDLDLNNKDSMAALMGKWIYEIAELGALAKAEASRQKSFLSREVDEFRPAYGHRNIRSPRQLVFGGTTNEHAWNKDETGGRRFWPVECPGDINVEGLAAVRDQLFAEAYYRYMKGDRFWPTSEEQRKIFDPEQFKRHQFDSYVDILEDFVSQQVSDFSLAAAGEYLKIDAARLTRDIQTRIGKALITLGCIRVEKRTNTICRFWYRPPVTPGGTGDKTAVQGGDDGIPF